MHVCYVVATTTPCGTAVITAILEMHRSVVRDSRCQPDGWQDVRVVWIAKVTAVTGIGVENPVTIGVVLWRAMYSCSYCPCLRTKYFRFGLGDLS